MSSGIFFCHFFVLVVWCSITCPRNHFRTPDPLLPEIHVTWANDSTIKHILKSSHLEEYPLFKTFDHEFLARYTLPTGAISYRYDPDKQIMGKNLTHLIESLLKEIRDGKQKFSDFVVMQDKDFNRNDKYGFIILSFKGYPFVVKLFIETPESFVKPFDKGFEPIFFFFMAGGVTRHLSGFTRIKNLIQTQNLITKSSHWSKRVTLPRKWFWIPKKSQWIKIVGKNIGKTAQPTIEIPSIYCVIADQIDIKQHFSIWNQHDRDTALSVCNYLQQIIDPHISNFAIEKGTEKIAIVDTEHFPTMVGFTELIEFDSYAQWYAQLVGKCVKDIYMRTKSMRREAQFDKHAIFLL